MLHHWNKKKCWNS